MIERLCLCFKGFLIGIFITIGLAACYWVFCITEPSNYEAKKDVFLIIDHPFKDKKNSLLFVNNNISSKVNNSLEITKFTIKIARLCGYTLKRGEYYIPSKVSLWNAIKILSKSKKIVHKFTIPEGLSVARVLDKLKENKFLIGEIETTPEEGSLLPDTYCFRYPTTRQQIIEQAQQAMSKFLKKEWKIKSEDCFLKTPEEAIILASIVQKESFIEPDTVAGMYLNRLRKNMKLQACPTVIYALVKGKRFARRLTYEDLKIDHPYNTYVYKGLPPGPITNPGREAILAVLHPNKTNYLFLFFDGPIMSKPHFSATYKEHQKAIAKYRGKFFQR